MYDRLLPQFWHHHIRALLHLPFMLKASQDRRFEYNRIAALESAREMIIRFQVLRPVHGYQSLTCKIIDFQAFTAAMFLVLNLFSSLTSSPKRDEEEDNRDWDLVTSTNDILQHASQATGTSSFLHCTQEILMQSFEVYPRLDILIIWLATDGVVASQAARALEMFVQARDNECPYSHKPGTTCKIVIPCFGTVSFGAGKDFARQRPPSQTPSAFSQTAGLPTPADSYSGTVDEPQSFASDPFVSFDSYLAQMPFDFSRDGHATQQPDGYFNGYGDPFTNVNLDLDQDWAWYPVAQQAAPPLQ